jgi:mannosyltransferase OCH1-like enzyme
MFPKHIHQIWFDFNNGIEIDEERMELMDMNKMNALKNKHKYDLWTLSMAIEFVEKYYPYYLSFLKKKWKYDIVKCDFFRYLLMYHYGGLYVDLDFVLTDNFMNMYENHSDSKIVLFEEWYDSVNIKKITKVE